MMHQGLQKWYDSKAEELFLVIQVGHYVVGIIVY